MRFVINHLTYTRKTSGWCERKDTLCPCVQFAVFGVHNSGDGYTINLYSSHVNSIKMFIINSKVVSGHAVLSNN